MYIDYYNNIKYVYSRSLTRQYRGGFVMKNSCVYCIILITIYNS